MAMGAWEKKLEKALPPQAALKRVKKIKKKTLQNSRVPKKQSNEPLGHYVSQLPAQGLMAGQTTTWLTLGI